MQRLVEAEPGIQLWVEDRGEPAAPALLLIMGANATGIAWPDSFVDTLAEHHRVIRYDHRDTGRSTWAFDERPYAIADLATDAITILDALGIDRAHVVGMSLGGMLVQLLLLDHPDRLLSATVFSTTALGLVSGAAGELTAEAAALPGTDPRLLEFWAEMAEPQDQEGQLAWRVEHWRLLNGTKLPFDAAEFRDLEHRVIAHAGTHQSSAAHAQAAQTGLDRGAELAGVRTPTLVIEAPPTRSIRLRMRSTWQT
jgi:pimeloyl-ACP methyl ester carboxylesterase